MVDENTIEIPEDWRQAVHPRSGGRLPVLHFQLGDDPGAALRTERAGLVEKYTAIVSNPAGDQELAELARRGAGPASDAARYAMEWPLLSARSQLTLTELYL